MGALQIESEISDNLDLFFHVAIDMLCIIDLEGHFLRVNPAWEKALGYQASELEGRDILELVHPDDIEETKKTSIQLLQDQQELLCFTNRYRHKNGFYHWIEWRGVSFEGRIFSVARDITTQKRKEQRQHAHTTLQRNSSTKSTIEMMHLFIDQMKALTESPIGFFHLVNPDQKSLTLQAWSSNTSQHTNFQGTQDPQCSIEETAIWVDCIQEQKTIIRNAPESSSNRKKIIREIVTPIINNGIVQALVGVGNKDFYYTKEDTETLEYLAQLASEFVLHRYSEESLVFLKDIVESSEDGIIGSDVDGIIHSWNPGAERLIQYSPEEACGHAIASLFAEESKELLNNLWSKLLNHHSLEHFEGKLQRKDGSRMDAVLTFVPIRNCRGEIMGISTIVRDITQRKDQERERSRLLDELARKNHELESFTYTVSHDLKTPLLTIQGFAAEVSENLHRINIPEAQENLEHIRNASRRMGLMLQNLLQLSRVTHSNNPFVPTDLRKVLTEVRESLSGLLAEQKALLLIPPNLPTIYGDPTRLHELFQNIIENSVKFRGPQSPRIEVIVDNQDHQWSIVVKDNGIGIEKKFQTKIFGLFQKLNPKSDGTGVGLALVSRIVELHGGSVNAFSEGRGTGTSIRVQFPKIKSVVM